MSTFLTDFDQWDDAFETAAPSQQYDMLKAAISEPIPIDYAEKVEFGFFLINVWEDLINHNQVDECLALIKTLRQQQPDLYQREFQYLDDLLVKYHLFHHQIDAVRDDLSQFQASPVQGIDQLSAVLDDLQFYGATEPLVDLCRAIYQPIVQSRKVFNGVETEFGDIVIFDQFERIYHQLQQGETVDWDAFKTEAIQYGLADKASQWTEIEHNLTVDVETGEEFAQRFKRDLGGALRHLLLNFCCHMQTQHQMSFVSSRAIWESILECLDTQKPSKKKLAHPDGYFAFNQKKLDRHLGQKVGGFFSMQQAKGVAIVWGIPFVYEFLQSKQIISVSVAQEAIATAQAFKPQLIRVLQKFLWQFDFVHRWPRPDSVPEAEFAAEAKQFAASIEQATPLSDDPSANPFSGLLGLADKEEIAIEPPAKPLQNQPTAEVEPTPLAQPAWQPPKPRKSPLQEAKGLNKSKSKRSGKKESGQGFN